MGKTKALIIIRFQARPRGGLPIRGRRQGRPSKWMGCKSWSTHAHARSWGLSGHWGLREAEGLILGREGMRRKRKSSLIRKTLHDPTGFGLGFCLDRGTVPSELRNRRDPLSIRPVETIRSASGIVVSEWKKTRMKRSLSYLTKPVSVRSREEGLTIPTKCKITIWSASRAFHAARTKFVVWGSLWQINVGKSVWEPNKSSSLLSAPSCV